MKLIAYQVSADGLPLEPALRDREWMQDQDRFPYRCLPLLVANQSGWMVRNPQAFTATWNGTLGADGVLLQTDAGEEPTISHSHFGHGVVTWQLPWLFRTEPGWNLVTRGVPNLPKDGAQALEGVIETDWAPMTFTMNWKMTRANHPVRWDEGEPFTFLYPAQRGVLAEFEPHLVGWEQMPRVEKFQYQGWVKSRGDFNARPGRGADEWQKNYLQGRGPSGGRPAHGHETKIAVPPFTRP